MKIGLVPQELSTDAFESVWATVRFSRGLFGKPPNPAHLEKVLRALSLWDKRDSKIMTLSGGMKRRVLIAKALSHEPRILFLDEPTAGVDVELRRDMWQMVRELRESGVTIILTTHYIEEAEEMADRIGVISKGELILVEDKHVLMRKLGKKQLTLQLQTPLERIPDALAGEPLELADDGHALVYTFDAQAEQHRHRGAAASGSASTASTSRTCIRARARSRTSSSAWCIKSETARRAHEHPRASRRDLPLRDGAHLPHPHAEHRLAGAVDVAVLRRVRLGDRLAHGPGRRRQLRRVHRPGPDDAVAAQREHLQRVVRHLHAEVGGHDLRAAVGAGLVRSRS